VKATSIFNPPPKQNLGINYQGKLFDFGTAGGDK
jgi:hypothetical protein